MAAATPSGAVDLAVAIPTVVGSILSFVGTSFILAVYVFMPPKPSHIRHALICNLIVAEFVLESNDSASGLMKIVQHKDLDNGPWCVANGFFTQLGVQAVDCCIFVMSCTLLYIIAHPFTLFKPSLFGTILLIAAPWILPLFTSFVALAKHYYHPVSGNWCWIQAEPKYLRYVLTHGWRFAIMVAVVAMAVRIHYYWKSHPLASQTSSEHPELLSDTKAIQEDRIDEVPGTNGFRPAKMERLPATHETRDGAVTASEAKKIRLLSVYPIIYIVLWLPGIANRVAEATGHEIRALIIMQASTTYIGLAHSITFGWIEVRGQFTVQKLLEMLLGFVLGVE